LKIFRKEVLISLTCNSIPCKNLQTFQRKLLTERVIILKKTKFMFTSVVLALALVAVPLAGALAQDTVPPPIDPQSWRFARDMTWDDWQDNPAFNWKIDGTKITPNVTRNGLLVLVDFADRPFIVSSPVGTEQLGNPQIGNVPKADLVEFWESFLNDPQDHYNNGLNNGITISEFWQENTQGRWRVKLDAVGVYTMPGYEFEYGLNDGMASASDRPAGFTTRSNLNSLAINAAIADGVNLNNYDFAFILHSGGAESQIWEEAGIMMFFDQKSVDNFFSARYRIDQMAAKGITIPTTTRTWLDQHDPARGGDGRGWWASTRYVPWTSWWAATGIWSSTGSITVGGRSFRLSMQGETNGNATFSHEFGHIVSIADNYHADVDRRTHAGLWELMDAGSMTGFGGPHTRYMVPNLQGGSVPAHMTTRTKRKLSLISDSQLTSVNYTNLRNGAPVVTEIFSRTTPIGDQFAAVYPDTLGVINAKVKAGKASNGLRLYGFTDAKPRILATTDWESDTHVSASRYDNYSLEVIDQVGYDSVQSDHGVLITKNRETLSESAPYTWVVNAHPGGLDTVDFYTPVGPAGQPSTPEPFRNNDNNHLSAALFHAGKSVTPNDYGVECKRTSQNNAGYTVVIGPDGKPITKSIADNTVNEYVDTYNNLHFYILDKILTPGPYGDDILSYQVAVRHRQGQAVNGALTIKANIEKEAPNRVAVANFSITNTGTATDIIRVGVDGYLSPVLLNDLYAIGAGETITVPVYVQLPADIRFRDLSGKIITLNASSETNGTKVASATVKAEDLVAYSFYVSMKPSKTELFVGESLTVDVFLQGDISYTQFATEIAFDASLLEYTGYVNLQGWAASVTKPSAGIVAVRSVPGMNMVAGSPCTAETKIVTLKFTVKNTFVGAQANTALSFASILVSPAGGVTGSATAPGQEVPLEFTRVGDASFQQNLALYPAMYSKATGTTMPVFNYGTGNILEEVYVECPLDTDFDGQRDLIRVQIRRPAESALLGVRVPAIFENSPYRDGTLSIPNHNNAASPPMQANADTSNYTYENDIKSIKPRASEWPWSDAANVALDIPASHGAKPLGAATRISSIAGIGPGSFGNYMLARGYAIIAGSSIGNRYSDGYTSCGDIDETIAAMAVIQWLNGNARAYTNQNCTTEVDATEWSNGKVAMSGVSYNGTLPIAVACSGVEGLKAIIPVAAISSWYDYYRENGGVMGPGTYQGEDADILAKYCNSRSTRSAGIPSNDRYYNNTPNKFGIGTRDQFNQLMTKMFADQDRIKGDYNRFWDDRNYIATADQVKAGIIVQHGLADWNVKTKNFDQFYRAVKEKTDTPIKLVLHRGGHAGIYTHEPFFRNAHKWLDYYLYGIDNGIVASMPEVSVISSQTGQYQSFSSWPVPGSVYTRYYLAPDVNGAAGALSLAPPVAAQKTIVDSKANWINGNLSSTQLSTWETRIFNAGNLTAASTERLAFVSDITQNVRFSGTVKATLQIASDKPFGYMTAALVEIGAAATRSFSTSTAESIAAHNGVAAISIVRPSGVSTSGSASSYRVITMGHTDVQNPNPLGKTYIESAATNYIPEYYYRTVATVPGQFYSYTFEFEPNDWEFRAGDKLAIMVYTTDYRYTPTPGDVAALTIQFGPGTYVEIPALGVFNTITLPEPAPEEEITQEEQEPDDPTLLNGDGGFENDIKDLPAIDE
jgi:putative CocE/NonD family hydrolase